MAGDLYLKSYSAGFVWQAGVQASAGAADAGKLVALDAAGLIDPAMIGPGLINGITVSQGGGNLATNTAVGVDALTANTTGLRNTGLGYWAGKTITTGNDITAVGAFALPFCTGNNNTSVGSSSGAVVNTGVNNVIFGYSAAAALTTGGNNVFIGSSAAITAQTAQNCIYIGQACLPSAINNSNEIVIGQGITGLGSNTTHIGSAATTETRLHGVVNAARAVNTVATLPAAAANTYARSVVADATQTLTAGIGAVVAGGGANIVPVFCDGTNWRIG